MFYYLISLAGAFTVGFYAKEVSSKAHKTHQLFSLYRQLMPTFWSSVTETASTIIELTLVDIEQYLLRTCELIDDNNYLLQYKINGKRYQLIVHPINGPDTYSSLERGRQSILPMINDHIKDTSLDK